MVVVVVVVGGQQAHSYTHSTARAHTRISARISRPDRGNQAVSTGLPTTPVRTRGVKGMGSGGGTDKRRKEKEIKQQKTCSFSAAAVL